MKKIVTMITIISIVFTLAACGSEDSENRLLNSGEEKVEVVAEEAEYTGTISKINDNEISLKTEDGEEIIFVINDTTEYEMDIESMGMQNNQEGEMPPEIPSGDDQQGGMPPEMPTGDNQEGEMPPEMPTGDNQEGEMPPEIPSGDNQQGEIPMGDNQQGGTPPEKPSDDGKQGEEPPEKPSEDGQQNAMSSENSQEGAIQQMNGEQHTVGSEMLTVGTSITVTVSDDGIASKIEIKFDGNQGGGFGGNNENISYTAVNTYDEDTSISDQTINSTGKDENAILVSSGSLTLENTKIDRTSDNSTGGDNASFYGVGAAVLTTDGVVNIADSTITTDAAGGAGVFAYGNGIAYISDTTITTKQNTSGGIHVAGGGTLYAWDLNVETNGESAAAIRSDRGSGTIVVNGGSYTSNGLGSPAIYSTADISVNNAELTATGSEAICIEGKNSIRLYDCNLSGNMSDDSRNDCTWNVILYQSMSGDSTVGNSRFEMVGGSLDANNGGIFYTTNTESTFVISDVDITTSDDCEFLLKCTGNNNQRGWGTEGSNGAQCSFTAIKQVLNGNIIWDSVSTLDLFMTEGSTLTGAFINDESNAGNGGSGYANLNVAEGCTWVVTNNSTLSTLTTSGTIVDENGKTVSVVGTDGTIFVSGNSNITITVESYSDEADLTNCGTATNFADYAVEKL